YDRSGEKIRLRQIGHRRISDSHVGPTHRETWSSHEGKRAAHIPVDIHKDRVIGSRITATDHELVSSCKKAADPLFARARIPIEADPRHQIIRIGSRSGAEPE